MAMVEAGHRFRRKSRRARRSVKEGPRLQEEHSIVPRSWRSPIIPMPIRAQDEVLARCLSLQDFRHGRRGGRSRQQLATDCWSAMVDQHRSPLAHRAQRINAGTVLDQPTGPGRLQRTEAADKSRSGLGRFERRRGDGRFHRVQDHRPRDRSEFSSGNATGCELA